MRRPSTNVSGKAFPSARATSKAGLRSYPDGSFDYVILNQSLQEIRKVFFILREALRVGNRVIVGFPNFAYINARHLSSCFGGIRRFP